MATISTIDDVSNIRSISAAVAANAGAIAIQNVNGVLKQVDDQGVVSSLGGGGGVTSIVAGTGISISGGTGAVTITNSAPFGSDTTVQLNNGSGTPVNAWLFQTALTTATAGAEVSDMTVSLLNAGAAGVAAYYTGAGVWGVGTSTVNLTSYAAGSRGITITSTGSNTAFIEGKMTTTTASNTAILDIAAYNGTNRVGILEFTNGASTTRGTFKLWVDNALTLAMSATNTLVTFPLEVDFTASVTGFARGGNQQVDKSVSGNLLIGCSVATNLAFYTSNTTRVTLTSLGSLVTAEAARATNATDGFLYIPTCAGTPTGTPTTQTGTVAMIYDTTNHKLYIYDAGWKGGTAPGVWS